MTAPDLLDLLAEHDHATGCDYSQGFITGLRRAATYVQDYAGDLPREVVARLQWPMLRAVDVATCGVCNPLGCVLDAQGRSTDHHPLTKDPS